ncbi:MAG: hypothetical protein ACPHP0_07750 [Flavobacteriaceae bacterium]
MNNLLLISTSYRTPDLAEFGFAFGQRVIGFSIEQKRIRNKRNMRIYTSWAQ